jgi:hypothetical protein
MHGKIDGPVLRSAVADKKRHKQRGEPRKQFSPIIEISKQ